MKKYLPVFFGVLFFLSFESFLSHPGDKMSVGSIKYSNGNLVVNITLFTEDMDLVLSHLNRTNVSFQEYTKKPFPAEIIAMVKNYVEAKVAIKVNNLLLKPNFQGVNWVPLTIDTDNAAIKVQLTYPCMNQNQIKTITVTNALLIKEVYGQKNILNITLNDEVVTLTFDKAAQTIQQTIN